MTEKSPTAPDVAPKGFIARLLRTWEIYSERRLFTMLLLGFSSGLPFLLVFGTMSAWLRTAGISRTDIG
ncbi:MAG: MFS transporter, partial [Parvibaculum sp.]